MTETRSWTLRINAPCVWLTANDRRYRNEQARLVKLWRGAIATAARQAKLPTGLDRIRVDAVVHFVAGHAPVRDLANVQPTLKAAVDGLGPSRVITRKGGRYVTVGYGLIPDDSDKHLSGPYLTAGDPIVTGPYGPLGVLELIITEVL